MPPPLDNFENHGHKYQFPISYDGMPTSAPDQGQDQFDPDISLQSVNSNASLPIPKTGRSPANKGVDTLESLRALPVLREIPWKDGKDLTAEQISRQSTRVQTRGAFLLVTRGHVRDPPCNRCVGNTGRFSLCVSLEGWFKGACATCEMATRGNLCSLRKELEESTRNGTSTFTKPALEELESPVSDRSEPVSLKRKRTSNAPGAGPTSQTYVSPYNQDGSWNQDNTQSYTPAAASYAHQPQNTPQEPRPPLLDYGYQKQNPLNGTKRHHLIQRAHRESQEPANRPSSLGSGYSVNAYTGARVGGSSEARGDGVPVSLSPSIPLPQPSWQDYNTAPAAAAPRTKPTSEVLLIDTLSRKKQKQIFSIIGGIQSGIRNVRQQTEDLQKQLDLLQEALGIGTDKDDDV